jgi:putative sterol carrier protein
LVESRRVAPQTLARITQAIVDPEAFAEMGNLFWKTCIAEGVTPKTFHEKNMVPRPDSIAAFMQLFPAGINAAAAGDRQVILQFRFSGQDPGDCHFIVAKGRIEARQGLDRSADVTIEAPFEVWADIMTGKTDGQQMFLEQKYTLRGDLPLMLACFKRRQGSESGTLTGR